MARSNAAPVTRRSFSRLQNPLEVPHLIDIQRRSFEGLTDPKKGMLRETINDISPIEDYTGNLAIVFSEFKFDEPPNTIDECREKDMTYSRPLNVDGRLPEQGDRRDPRAVRLHGRLPVDDRPGHVHHQRHRARRRHAAGPLPRRLRDGAQGRREAGLHREPDAGPRLLAGAGDRQEGPRLRPHRPQAQAAGHRAAARDGLRRGREAPRDVRQLGLHAPHDRRRHRGDEDRGRRADRAVQEAAPGRAALGRRRPQPARAALLRPEALRPHPGRPLQAERPPRPRHRPRHPGPDPRRHHRPGQGAHPAAEAARRLRGDRRGEPDQGLRRGGDHLPARAGPRAPRRVRALRQPAPAHGRRADSGGLPDRPLPDGARGPRAPHHRGRRRDHPADDHQHPPGGGGDEGVLRLLAALAVHGPDQLPGRPHPPPPPLGARRGRPDPRARPDRGARRAPDPLRPDVPDRDS